MGSPVQADFETFMNSMQLFGLKHFSEIHFVVKNVDIRISKMFSLVNLSFKAYVNVKIKCFMLPRAIVASKIIYVI